MPSLRRIEDPVARLVEDHTQLTKRLTFVQAQLQKARAATGIDDTHAVFRSALPPLLHDLLEHFAEEEEAVFPFVQRTLPDAAPMLVQLLEGHDRICAAAADILALTSRGSRWFKLASTGFDALVSEYEAHDAREQELLRLLAKRLDQTEREALTDVLLGL